MKTATEERLETADRLAEEVLRLMDHEWSVGNAQRLDRIMRLANEYQRWRTFQDMSASDSEGREAR